MCDNSGGINSGAKKKSLDKMQIKTRSNSLGSVDISMNEMNKIIFSQNTVKTSSEVKKCSDKIRNKNNVNSSTMSIQGDKNLDLGFDVMENTTGNIFFPKKTIGRTPPKSNNTNNSTETLVQKRQRSESSPEGVGERQKIRKQSSGSVKELGNREKEEATIPNYVDYFNNILQGSTDNTLQNILEALTTIHNFVENDQFNGEDIFVVRKATFNLP